MTDYRIINEGPSRKGGFTCFKVEGTAAQIDAAATVLNAVSGVRYIDPRRWADDDAVVTFEAASYAEARIRAKLELKKDRRLVAASADAAAMGDGFDGFGKVFRVLDEDACVYGLQPGQDYSVKYAYFA